MLNQNSARSSFPNSTFSSDDYAVNNSKFMRVEPNMDLLLGELDNALSLNLNGERSGSDKRTSFANQKSATSVINEATGSQATPAWFNRSCPDFGMDVAPKSSMLNQVQEIMEEEGEEEHLETQAFSYPNMYADWHHSTPNLFSSPDVMDYLEPTAPAPPQSSSDQPRFLQRPNLLALSPKKRSQSVRHLNMGNPSSFSVYHSPEKTSCKQSISHEDIVLSPIGDGATDALFDKLQKIQEFSESGEEGLPEPIEIPF